MSSFGVVWSPVSYFSIVLSPMSSFSFDNKKLQKQEIEVDFLVQEMLLIF
jgi:hypothetical protein